MDTQKLRELLDQRDKIDAEIVALVNSTTTRKPQRCSKCQQAGHSARTCQQQ